jgi:hypothetical protein
VCGGGGDRKERSGSGPSRKYESGKTAQGHSPLSGRAIHITHVMSSNRKVAWNVLSYNTVSQVHRVELPHASSHGIWSIGGSTATDGAGEGGTGEKPRKTDEAEWLLERY